MNRVVQNSLLTVTMVSSALLVASCGGAARHSDGISQQHRRDIDALWDEIQDLERRSGLDDGDRATVETVTDGDADISPRSTTSRGAVRPSLPRRDMCHQKEQSRDDQCGDVCELAGAICVNAHSICRIANELADEDWAHQKCNSATMSCVRADNRCCQCGS